jgi:hypothetical protein
MDLVVVSGKSRKNTRAYILIPPDTQVAIQTLLDSRSAVGINPSNPFVFARLNADTPISGTTDLREIVDSCRLLKEPDRITTTKLRKYIATISQVCLNNN